MRTRAATLETRIAISMKKKAATLAWVGDREGVDRRQKRRSCRTATPRRSPAMKATARKRTATCHHRREEHQIDILDPEHGLVSVVAAPRPMATITSAIR